MSALVALTTDFGTKDSYVAQMKGVLLREAPRDARIVDLSHELVPYDIQGAALFLKGAVPHFPEGTIHVAVVDPGVGSARGAIAARCQGQWFVGPDNGVFGYVLDRTAEVHTLDPALFTHVTPSRTFHGRDLFAPAAAQLAHGKDLGDLGPRAETYQHLVFPLVEMHADTLTGRVLHIDHYGNLITNIQAATLTAFLGDTPLDAVVIQIADRHVFGILDHYAQGKPDGLLSLFGSSGLLEIAAREASAAQKLGVEVGNLFRLTVR